MDKMRACGARDVGSIPTGGTSRVESNTSQERRLLLDFERLMRLNVNTIDAVLLPDSLGRESVVVMHIPN